MCLWSYPGHAIPNSSKQTVGFLRFSLSLSLSLLRARARVFSSNYIATREASTLGAATTVQRAWRCKAARDELRVRSLWFGAAGGDGGGDSDLSVAESELTASTAHTAPVSRTSASSFAGDDASAATLSVVAPVPPVDTLADFQGEVLAERVAPGAFGGKELLVRWARPYHTSSDDEGASFDSGGSGGSGGAAVASAKPEWVRESELQQDFPAVVKAWRKQKKHAKRDAKHAKRDARRQEKAAAKAAAVAASGGDEGAHCYDGGDDDDDRRVAHDEDAYDEDAYDDPNDDEIERA